MVDYMRIFNSFNSPYLFINNKNQLIIQGREKYPLNISEIERIEIIEGQLCKMTVFIYNTYGLPQSWTDKFYIQQYKNQIENEIKKIQYHPLFYGIINIKKLPESIC